MFTCIEEFQRAFIDKKLAQMGGGGADVAQSAGGANLKLSWVQFALEPTRYHILSGQNDWKGVDQDGIKVMFHLTHAGHHPRTVNRAPLKMSVANAIKLPPRQLKQNSDFFRFSLSCSWSILYISFLKSMNVGKIWVGLWNLYCEILHSGRNSAGCESLCLHKEVFCPKKSLWTSRKMWITIWSAEHSHTLIKWIFKTLL